MTPPRSPIAPLPARRGVFAKTLAEAKLRRRRGVLTAAVSVGVVLALTSASFAVGASMHWDRDARTTPAGQDSVTTSGTPTPTPGFTTPPVGPRASPRKQGPGHSGGTQPGAPAGPGVATQRGNPSSYLQGRVVDATGVGVAGLYVLPSAGESAHFRTDGYVAARTDGDGYYRIGCPSGPVLIAAWPVNAPFDGAVGNWAPAFVGGGTFGAAAVPPCGGSVHQTVVEPGATLTGSLRVAADCPADQTYTLEVRIGDDPAVTVQLGARAAGATYTVTGLPAGSHTLEAGGQLTSLTLAEEQSLTLDTTLDCAPEPPPTDPTDTSTGPVSEP
jgi:hypothetical protein